jgi:hypothetical protein
MKLKILSWLIVLLVGSAHGAENYSFEKWKDDVSASRLESGGALAFVTALGLTSWKWGSQKTFRMNNEGWFGDETGSGGTDKLGHAFSSYAITTTIADRLVSEGRSREQAALSAALTTQAIMLYVELFDGYSGDHGFSREDVVMNMMGTGLSYARVVNPSLREKLDFRMEYMPSGYKGFRPISDYEGQKYLFALKLNGFDAFRNTSLKYLELQTGYYTRGFSKEARAAGEAKEHHAFIGVALNLTELLFGKPSSNDSESIRYGRLFLENFQIPNTAVRSDYAR